MKKKLYLLAAFIAMNATAHETYKQASLHQYALNASLNDHELYSKELYLNNDNATIWEDFPEKLVYSLLVLTSNVEDTDPLRTNISIHLNAASETIKVKSNFPITEIAIYSLMGKKLIQNINQNSISLTRLTRGIHILKVKVEGRVLSWRIILQ